jgi:hypothetical protein
MNRRRVSPLFLLHPCFGCQDDDRARRTRQDEPGKTTSRQNDKPASAGPGRQRRPHQRSLPKTMVTGSAGLAQQALVVSEPAKASTPQIRLPAPREMQSAPTPRSRRGATSRYRTWITQGSALPQSRSGPAVYPQPPHRPPTALRPGPAHRPCRRRDHGRCRHEAVRQCSDSRWSIRVLTYLIETPPPAVRFRRDRDGGGPVPHVRPSGRQASPQSALSRSSAAVGPSLPDS